MNEFCISMDKLYYMALVDLISVIWEALHKAVTITKL